jgi:hypothetical protein
MKKIFLIGLLIGVLNAADNDLYDNSIAVNIGYGSMMADAQTYTGVVYGFQLNRNLNTAEGAWKIDALQFVLEYASLNSAAREGALRVGANALWYIENMSVWTPFVKAGLGLQYISGTESIATGNSFYGTVGAGVEYQLRGDTSVIGEITDHISFSGENNVRLAVGLKYSFGQEY